MSLYLNLRVVGVDRDGDFAAFDEPVSQFVNFRIAERFYAVEDNGSGAKAVVHFDPATELYVEETAEEIADMINRAKDGEALL